MVQDQEMRDRVVVVSGGGTGIGRATAELFAQAGAWVVVVGRRSAPLEVTAQSSERIVPVPVDILCEADLDRLIQTIERRWACIDVLVNNAAIFIQCQLDHIDFQTTTSIFATNVIGPSLLCKAALPLLKATRGSIVNVSSTFGHKAAPMIAHYAASKAAIEHLTRCWALELAPSGVRVNAIAPGPTETDVLAQSGLSLSKIMLIKNDEEKQIPLGRRGTPNEVANWIVKLSDPSAAWISGQVISVDGGLSIS
ncbi:3-oxoacyl-[acyl-carrier-protein] reductase FabG [Thalassoglobus neptunius]|uniref:3-oxoacyl-[acyl-carrier-protein] reductase FabG n=1 Tax=Thalassoglobus neptunius TaxID=1938619 RepID=A0A5C5VQ38_9PLAN|nr:SDR family oxidoreductase [Thalassoglobus neptunius]TWT39809.1 3-oxoacyl-[acyl-carrier-protein] reductase FabG [Thalassoglobus neptunius]